MARVAQGYVYFRRRSLVVALAALSAPLVACSASRDDASGAVAQPQTAVPSFDVDLSQTSVSGLSSGAFMAVQFHVAYSSIMTGVAAFAGGPFDCAQGSLSTALTTCMSDDSTHDIAPYVAVTNAWAKTGDVDPPANLAAQRVFLFGGADDTTVEPAVVDALDAYYRAFVTSGSVVYERRHPGAAHTMPTVSYGGSCDQTASPYIGKCGYDGAGKALAQIYGPLAAPASTLSGEFLELPQGDFIADPAAHSLGDTAYAYVPKSCANGEKCRIHVAFHGCLQYASGPIGDAFYRHAGYNEWADTNHVIVLYPQTIATNGSNPKGCWDFWGYDSKDCSKKSGPQMAMVRAMIDRLAGGAPPKPAAPNAPNAPAPDASPAPPSAPLAPPSPESDAGAPDLASDAGPACVTSSNADHVAAGRASDVAGFAFAQGSQQALGADSTLVWTSLARVSADTWVAALCP